MDDTIIWIALGMGLLSAASLPLGALSTLIWTPSDRAIALLMAFGAGALLAALTIDLVATALERGHFVALALGSVAGGLLFVGLNHLINMRGGFLRKLSTTIRYLERQRTKQLLKLLANVERISLDRPLEREDGELLASELISRSVPAGIRLYRCGDPSENLHLVEEGEVALVDPSRGRARFARLGPGAAFGRRAFFTGARHATEAETRTTTRLLLLPRDRFNAVLDRSAGLREATTTLLGSEEFRAYLVERHRQSPEQAGAWIERLQASVEHDYELPMIEAQGDDAQRFTEIADRIERFPLFDDIPEDELELVAARLIRKDYGEGEVIFREHEEADRMYVVDRGSVALIDPDTLSGKTHTLNEGAAFGALAFLTDAPHSVSAVALTAATLWELRRGDFEQLIKSSATFSERVKRLLGDDATAEYLQQRQGFDPSRASEWLNDAVQGLDRRSLMPSIIGARRSMHEHGGAPVAIWLGILLDGIPESLVIGVNAVGTSLSWSLLGGLFLSNYPESLSSSAGMREQGFSFSRVLVMWTSLMLLTGIGAALGSVYLNHASPVVLSLIEGVAAGAMLTMIAETMLPEAYIRGDANTGLATLFGYLAAIFLNTLH